MGRKVHPYLRDMDFIAFSHRGDNVNHPENTMAAFEAAVRLDFRYIETDIQVTRDGTLIVFHDDHLDRLTDHKGFIADLDWADFKSARVGGREPIPLFETLLTTYPDLHINIEPKNDAAVRPMMEMLAKHDAFERVCIGSFSGDRLKQVREIGGEKVCTSHGPMDVARLRFGSWGLPFGELPGNCVQIPVVQYNIRLVDEVLLNRAHSMGLKVHVWTINDASEMERLINLGVDGLMSDDASLLKSVVEAHGLWPS